MANNAHNAYLESRILTADPMELVRLMYQAAIAEVRNARMHLSRREIALRGKAVSQTCAILTELSVSLDRERGGEYAERLRELYGYMMHRMTEANFLQREEPLVEVLGLLTTLLEGWEGAQRHLAEAAPPRPAAVEIESAWKHAPEATYSPQAWSF